MPANSGCNATAQSMYGINLPQQMPNARYPDQCAAIGGTNTTFNDQCARALGKSEFVAAQIDPWYKGQTRVLWHGSAVACGIVFSGTIQAYVVSPTGVPWSYAINNI